MHLRASVELGHPLAVIVALLAMTGALWIARLLHHLIAASGSTWVLELTFVVGCGAGAYVVVLTMTRFLTRGVREAASRLSLAERQEALDQTDAVKNAFRHLARTSHAAEFISLGSAVDMALTSAKDQQARQTAWTIALVHDMKAPLAAGANAIEAISKRVEPSDERVLRAVASDLRALVSDTQRMVDVVRFATTDVDIAWQQIDFLELVEEVIERAPARVGVDVRVRGAATGSGDRRLLARALENLISNAVRYARTRVAIEVLPGLFRIADDGGGLPAPFSELSLPFRSDPTDISGVASDGGVGGIGLFLARRVMELHGGRIVVESTGLRGTVLLAYVGARQPNHG